MTATILAFPVRDELAALQEEVGHLRADLAAVQIDRNALTVRCNDLLYQIRDGQAQNERLWAAIGWRLALGSLTGGFLAVVALRWAGL